MSGNAERLEQAVEALHKTIFFIVGCQKSGTTWLQKILNGHPQCACHGEAYFAPVLFPLLQQAVQVYNGKHKAGEKGTFSQQQFEALLACVIGLKFSEWVGGKESIKAVGEKTPEHAMSLQQLGQVFPGMRAVHLVRDPRDVVVSGWHHNLRQKGDMFLSRFPSMLPYAQYTVKNHWLRYIQAADDWGRAHPQAYICIRYEDLLDDPDAALEKVFQTLEIDDSAAAIDIAKAAGRPLGDSAVAPCPGESGSFFRKGKASGWRDELPGDVADWIVAHAGDWMTRFGY